MKLIPLFDRVLIKPQSIGGNSEFKFVLSDISKERPNKGEVVSIGEGVDLDYKKCKMAVSVGDKVMFDSYAGVDVELDGEKYVLIRQIDIVGVYDEREDNC